MTFTWITIANRFIVHLQASSTFVSTLRKISNRSTDLKEIMVKKIEEHRKVVKQFREKYGKRVISKYTVDQMYGGMRGMNCVLSETSELDPEEGIRFRDRTLPDCLQQLPRAPGGNVPLPEGMFWLMMTGDIPTYEQAKSLSQQWAEQAELPPHVVTMLNNFPPTLHPMAKFSAAVTACNTESVFTKAFKEGVPESRYWEFIYDDAISLIAKIPPIAAIIYRNTYHKGGSIGTADPSKDVAHNFTSMLGYEDSGLTDDHEGGNVSSHTVQLVGSALSDPFMAYGAGMQAFAGPIHGLAIQEALSWILKIMERYGPDVTEDHLREFAWETLKSGQVIPGYGHAVLRKTDPRFTTIQDFAIKNLPHESLVKTVLTAYKVVPSILTEYGKVQNPWPNCDAISGVPFKCYGLKETRFYTVIFGFSRALGSLASLIWNRALCLPMEEPTSVTTDELMQLAGAVQKDDHIPKRNDNSSVD